MNIRRFVSVSGTLITLIFIILLLGAPNTAIKGAKAGLLACSEIIIPALFPVSVCVIYIFSQNIILNSFNKISMFTTAYLKTDGIDLLIFTSSFLGGYPVGAILIKEMYHRGQISRKNANISLYSAVNAGPAFIISAVGGGIFLNRNIGIIMFISACLSSITLFIFSRFLKERQQPYAVKDKNQRINGNFSEAVSKAASCVLNICAYVLFFSTVIHLVFNNSNCFIKTFLPLLEVTNGILNSNKNILYIAFLLGFGGLCVHMQILSLVSNIKPNLIYFFASRLLHGILNVLYLKLLLRLTGYSIPTITNGVSYETAIYNVSIPHAISLLILSIAFVASLSEKNRYGKRNIFMLI